MTTVQAASIAGARPSFSSLIGIALVSSAAMLVEVSLTRVFSLLLYYHYAFLVVGLAMLGLAAGGLLLWDRGIRRRLPTRQPALWGLLAGLSTAAAAILMSASPDRGALVLTILAAIPFGMVGATTAALLDRFPAHAGRVYAADLAGAAAGILLSVPLLGLVGALNALLVAAAMMGWGGFSLIDGGRRARIFAAATALLLSAMAVAGAATGSVDVEAVAIQGEKTMAGVLRDGGRVVFSRWDAFARTDVVAPAGKDDLMYLFIDGGSAAAMLRADGKPTLPAALRNDIGLFPFHYRPAGKVLSIGPGGGRDVLMALVGGADRVTAVEVNPGAVEAVRRFADFNGGLYDRPDVEVVVDEGRSFLRRSAEKYDTIYISLAVTQAAERTGYAMTENYLYTVEAMRDYLDRLKPGGQLVFKLHDRFDLERVIRTTMQALQQRGVPSVQVPWQILALSQVDAHGMSEDDVMYPLLIVQRDPYTPEEVHHHLSVAQAVGLATIYVPGAGGTGALAGLTTPGSLSLRSRSSPNADLSPTTDDRPFFYLTTGGPPPLSLLLLVVSALLAAAAAWRLRRSVPTDVPTLRLSLAYFGALGFAFMLVEVVLIQQLILYLGHPTPAVATVLFALLVSGALGSRLSSRLDRSLPVPAMSTALAGGLVLAYTQLLPLLTQGSVALPQPYRILIAAAIIAPLGVLMGMPFPTGLRQLSGCSPVPVGSLAWIANGFASVFGASAAIVAAVAWGFTVTLAVGGLSYLVAALLAVRVAHLRAEPASRTHQSVEPSPLSAHAD